MGQITERARLLMRNYRFSVFCLKGQLPKQIFSPHGKFIDFQRAAEVAEKIAQEVRDELVWWNDPKKLLPTEDARVLCKVQGCEYTEYLVLNWNQDAWWTYAAYDVDGDTSKDGWVLFNGEVIGWREIHE